MRALIALASGMALAAAAQVSMPPQAPAEKPPLRYNGKPIVLDFECREGDIQAGGLACTMQDPCPVYLEVDSVEAVGDRIFLAGNIHTTATTLYSVLLASTDGGKTWREPYERIPAAGLDRIQFIDFQNGWVSGETQRPLPRDPFFLVTADGGKQWEQRLIFADQQYGAVAQFGFSSRASGSVVIDRGFNGDSGRYELYETPNGGVTWNLRQTSEEPIQIKQASETTNEDWRVRPDAATKAYRVERHAGNRWRAVAAFSISIGFCKPPEQPAPPADAGAPGNF